MAAASVSVLVPVRDRTSQLANLVLGLRRACPLPGELIVARMGGEDPARALALAGPVPVSTIDVGGEELPLSRARNKLARAAEGELLVFLDVDCVPGRDLVEAFAAVLEAHDVLAVGRTLYLPPGVGSGPEQELTRVAQEHPARAGLFDGELRVDRRHDLFWSLNFAVRRDTFLARIDGFDEGYRGYGIEDTDFALRAARAGVELGWVREALAFHQAHPPTRLAPQSLPGLVRNAKRFQQVWGRWPARGWLAELAADGAIRWDEEAGEIELIG